MTYILLTLLLAALVLRYATRRSAQMKCDPQPGRCLVQSEFPEFNCETITCDRRGEKIST